MALNVVSSDRLSTNVKTSNLATGLSDKVGQSKNIAINGAMNVAQRGTSTTTNADFCVDRFMCLFGGTDEAPTYAQHALTSSDTGPWAKGFRNSLHITNGNQTSGAGTSDYVAVDYRVEAQDLANSGWDYTSSSSYITISYWVKSSVAQNFYTTLKTDDGTAQNYAFETGALSADTWTKITKKIPGNSNIQIDNNNGEGFRIRFVAFRGTDMTSSGYTLNTWGAYNGSARMPDNTSTWYTTNDSTFEITGVQIEVGDTATEFEHRSYGDELLRCQRYCYAHITPDCGQYAQISMGSYYNASNLFGYVSFPVTMRTKPTLLTTDATDAFNVYRNGGVDFVNNFVLSANESGANGAAINNADDASGTAGHSAIIRRGASSTNYFVFAAEL
tara:strand:- start:425 stop:1588 length:1164 start_codon:yes stop_codon:yes gene_type:complete